MRPYTHRSLSRRRHSMSRASGGYATDFDFVSTWDTTKTSAGSSTSTQAKLPLVSGGTYNFNVDWGDGSNDDITAYNQAEVTHTYSSSGIYDIRITGQCEGWSFNNTGDKLKISSITNWGKLNLSNTTGHFYGCSNLVVTALDAPTLGTKLINAFRGCTLLSQVGNNWDVSTVTDLSQTFWQTAFNQDIGSWDVSNVTLLTLTFAGTPFNQDIGSWDVSNVINFGSTFGSNPAFNQDIGSWDVSSALSMGSMFEGATAFNQDIGSWITTLNTSLENIFFGASSFNQNIDSWDVSNVQSFTNAFRNAIAFNQPLNSWDVSGAYNFDSVFRGATSFNRPLSNWTLGAIYSLNSCFSGATSFDQDLSSWDMSSIYTMNNLFTGVTLSTANYDAILIGWAAQDASNGLSMDGGGSKYSTAAAAARASLIADDGWSIVDGGPE